MKIIIQTIPHADQTYDTIGNWWWEDRNTLQVRVSRMTNWKYEAAAAVHEVVEALWCKAAGIDEEVVTQFDKNYEACRTIEDGTSEPGDHPSAPYYDGHQLGTKIEKLAFGEWAWAEYDREVVNL